MKWWRRADAADYAETMKEQNERERLQRKAEGYRDRALHLEHLEAVALRYRDLWLICHENNPRAPEEGELIRLGHLRGLLFAAVGRNAAPEPVAWISVTERLPKNHEWSDDAPRFVLAYSATHDWQGSQVCVFDTADFYADSDGDDIGTADSRVVTHWMPIPPLYAAPQPAQADEALTCSDAREERVGCYRAVRAENRADEARELLCACEQWVIASDAPIYLTERLRTYLARQA